MEHITFHGLAALLVAPTVQWLKKRFKSFEEVPLAKFLVVGILSYGVAVLYVGLVFGFWEFANQEIINGTLITALAAIGLNVTRKTVKGKK